MSKKLLVVVPSLLKAQVQSYTKKDGTFVNAHDNGRQKAAPKMALPKKKADPKTGSAAPAKNVNIGSDKYPLHVKVSEKLPKQHADGSTHHVGGFKAPDYPEGGGSTDGDVMVHHNGKTYSATGKTGNRMSTGEDSYEYANKDDGDQRLWVSRSGHLMED